jgi:hypothetical protein
VHICGDQAKLSNVGTDVYPKFLCPPCSKSRRTLLANARAEGGQATKSLMLIEREHPNEYKLALRSSRIKPIGEGAEIIGVGNLTEHRSNLMKPMAEWQYSLGAKIGQQNFTDIMELNKKQFIAHQTFVNGETPDEAAKLWKQSLDDPTVTKIDEHTDFVRVITHSIPTRRGFLEKAETHDLKNSAKGISSMEDIRKMAANFQIGNMADVGSKLQSQCADMGGHYFKANGSKVSQAINVGTSMVSISDESMFMQEVDPLPSNLAESLNIADGEVEEEATETFRSAFSANIDK